MPDFIDVERFGKRLRHVREARGFTLEKVFQATGVSVATLSRIERGGSKEVDAGTFVNLCEWMGARSKEFRLDAKPPKTPGKRSAASTPEAVELYLRADKNLDNRTAALLAEMFRAAYQKLSQKGHSEK
jgi:transcriptional regulator with XRE-family HTH domain